MRNLLHFISMLLVMSVVSVGCSTNNDRFRSIDQLLFKNPDSALFLLENLEPKGQSEYALWGLLYAKATDKSEYILPDDSLIANSAEYYAGRGDSLETQSYYYLAVSHYNHDRHGEAIVWGLRAEQSAIRQCDYFYADQTYSLNRSRALLPTFSHKLHDC